MSTDRAYVRAIPGREREKLAYRLAMAREREAWAWERFWGLLGEDGAATPVERVRAVMGEYLGAADFRAGLERRLRGFDREMEARERLALRLVEPFERMLSGGRQIHPFPAWLVGLANEPGRDRHTSRRNTL